MSIRSIALGSVAALAIAGMAAAADMNATTKSTTTTTTEERTTGSDVSDALKMHQPLTKAEMKTAMPLDKVKDPALLKNAEVRTMNDERIGEIHSVTMNEDGKITGVKLDIGGFLGIGEHTVALDPAKLSYVTKRNIILSSFTKDELKALPAASS